MKKIAVFGGSGFIGKNFIEEFGNEFEIKVFGKKFINEIIIGGKPYPYKHTDYDPIELKQLLSGFDIVFNLSASKVKQELDFHDYMESAYISNNLMKAAMSCACEKYIQISSRLVYKNDAMIPWNEESKEEPKHYYGIAKLVSDKLLQLNSRESSTEMFSLRAAQVYGLLDGKIDPSQNGSLIMNCIKRAKAQEPQIINENSKGSRDYLYVKDLVFSMYLVLETKGLGGIYNIGSGNKHTPREVAELANEIYRNKAGISVVSDNSEDNMHVLLDISKAERELKYYPKYNLRQGILDMKRKAESYESYESR